MHLNQPTPAAIVLARSVLLKVNRNLQMVSLNVRSMYSYQTVHFECQGQLRVVERQLVEHLHFKPLDACQNHRYNDKELGNSSFPNRFAFHY